jgi:hypothetical protein
MEGGGGRGEGEDSKEGKGLGPCGLYQRIFPHLEQFVT